jgi:hypothetical protein
VKKGYASKGDLQTNMSEIATSESRIAILGLILDAGK